jgi:hypothetical protein
VHALALAGLFAAAGLAIGVLYVAIRLLALYLDARRAEREVPHDDYPHVEFDDHSSSHLTLIRGGKRDGVDYYRRAYRGRN